MASSQTLEEVSKGRENNLDFLRFALATLVVFSHSFALPGYAAFEPLSRLTRGQIDGGALAVDFFFVISGFLVTQSWQRSKGVGDYLKKRVLRIYPGFLAAVLLCGLVVGPLGADSLAAYRHAFHPARFLVNILQLKFVLPPVFTHLAYPSANGSLWTIRNEFLCYLMVALFGLVGLYRFRGVLLGLFGVTLLLYLREVYGHLPFCPGVVLPVVGQVAMWPRYLTQYLAGMCFYLYRDRIAYARRWIGGAAAVVVAACFLPALPAVLPICGAYLLFAFAFSAKPDLHRFAQRGDLSYGIYLYAFPIQQLLLWSMAPHMAPLLLFGLAFPLTAAMAWASWHLIEKPCLRFKSPTGPQRARVEPK